jgi:hypothetical protein
MILFGLSANAKIVDVETAFLYGELKKVSYMENPEGLWKTAMTTKLCCF